MKPGLYEQLITLALQGDLEAISDPRLYSVAPVDSEDAHTVIAQFLEHMLANALAAFRGGEAADRQNRLVGRIVAALVEELGEDWTRTLSIATPLRRLRRGKTAASSPNSPRFQRFGHCSPFTNFSLACSCFAN